MLGRNVFVLQALRFVERALENFVGRRAQILLRDAGNFRQALDLLFDFAGQAASATPLAFPAAAAPRRRPAQAAPRASAEARSAAGPRARPFPARLAAPLGPSPLVCQIAACRNFLTFYLDAKGAMNAPAGSGAIEVIGVVHPNALANLILVSAKCIIKYACIYCQVYCYARYT